MLKDYLNAQEKNQFLVLLSILQNFNGERSLGIKNPAEIETMIEGWGSRNNLTKGESKALKFIRTYLFKFCESVYNRLCDRDKIDIDKRLQKYDFRLVDDFTLKKVNKQLFNQVLENEQYRLFCEEIMAQKCKGCCDDHKECKLYDLFEGNLVPESTHDLINCKYAYQEVYNENL